jgi:hypothetical protein
MKPTNTTKSAETIGLVPHLICILLGCSVLFIMQPIDHGLEAEPQNVKLVGEGHVHVHMEGELFVGMTKEEIRERSNTFKIH